tara:strand:+ start:1103 stop:3898 length:2796 start_codon:yes stop_codon:yes gene_type:complete
VARFVTFNGVTLVHPGGATKVDVSQLAQVSAGATGIVALVGEAEGGQPNEVSAVGDINTGVPRVYSFTEPSAAKEIFRNGPLADAIGLAFDAANDPRIPGGAQRVLAIKTNQSTSATATLTAEHASPTAPHDVMDLFSRDYGIHTNGFTFEIVVSPADTDNNRLDMTIVSPDGVTEDITNVGNSPLLEVQYRGPDTPTEFQTGTMTAAMAGVILTDINGAFTAAVVGKWVIITNVPTGVVPAGDPFALHQVRRIVGQGGTTLTLDLSFVTDTGIADNLNGALYDYSIIHEAVGPFQVASVYTVTNPNDSITISGIPAADQNGQPAVLNTITGAGGTSFFQDNTDGPNYIRIISGPGAGQIRQVLASSAAANIITLTIQGIDNLGFNPPPVAGQSRIMLVNMSSGAATTPILGGAFARVEGGLGVADTLRLFIRPGFGEPNGVTAVSVVGAGLANAAPREVLTYNLLSDMTDTSTGITINTLVERINNGTNVTQATNPFITLGGNRFNARIGRGRDGTALASRLDWVDDATIGGAPDWANSVNYDVQLTVGFDLSWSNTFSVDSANLVVVPILRYRLLDALEQVIDAVNSQSAFLRAVKQVATGTPVREGSGVPQLNEPPTILTGGTLGTTAAADILNAFDQLIKQRHTTVVPLFSDDTATLSIASVHQATLSHTQLGRGAGKNEIDAILALDVSAAADPNSNATAQAELFNAQADINNENCAIVYQRVERLNVDGVVTMFEPHMLAVIMAGMQAGSGVGEPLTYKYIRATDVDYPVQLDPLDKTTSDNMLLSGILFVEPIEGKGFRVVKNISTYTKSDNLAYTDRNVREVLNHIAYDLRTGIEDRFTGLKATPATALSIKSFIDEKMQAYKDEEIIVDSNDPITGARVNAWRSIRVTISGDIATIRVEFFPVVGINYELITLFAQLPTISA